MNNALHAVLAHQGGWDEALFVMLPIAIFAGLLALANRRAAAALSDKAAPGTSDDAPPADSRGDAGD